MLITLSTLNGKVICMFPQIEERRLIAGITQKELCIRAGVHPTRYNARKNGRSGLGERSLTRLRDALDELIKEKQQLLEAVS